MGKGMNGLIAAACCVVIAVGAIWGYERLNAQAETGKKAEAEILHLCHTVVAEFKKRQDGIRVPAALAGNHVVETASDAEIRVRLKGCADQVPEFSSEISRLLGI